MIISMNIFLLFFLHKKKLLNCKLNVVYEIKMQKSSTLVYIPNNVLNKIYKKFKKEINIVIREIFRDNLYDRKLYFKQSF